ncbi:MAG: SLATT domain-containing protein [Ornithinimicrobium sp.]
MTDVRNAVEDELKRLEEDILYTEKGHFSASNEHGRVHLALGLLATITSAVAATTIIGKSDPWVPGVLALIAAVASAVLTFVKPDERAAQHLQSGRALGALRVRIRQTRTIDLPADHDVDAATWKTAIQDLTTQKTDADNSAPPVSDRIFKKAQQKIQQGDFKHDTVPDAVEPPRL